MKHVLVGPVRSDRGPPLAPLRVVDRWTAQRWAHNRGEAPPPTIDPPRFDAADPDVRRARTIARWMDDRYLDPILGFVLPGVGDLIGSLLGLYIVSIAAKRGLPRIAIARMLLNLAIDAALGVVPIVGDMADVAFKANDRNLALLETRITRRDTWRDWAAVLGALGLFVALLALLVWTFVRLVRWVF